MEPRFSFEPKPGKKSARSFDGDDRQEPMIGGSGNARLDADIDDDDRPIYLQHEHPQKPIRRTRASRAGTIAWTLLGGFAVIAAVMIGLAWWRLDQAPAPRIAQPGYATPGPAVSPTTENATPAQDATTASAPPAPLSPPTKPELDSFPPLANAPAVTPPPVTTSQPLDSRDVSEPVTPKAIPSEPTATADSAEPIRLRPPQSMTTATPAPITPPADTAAPRPLAPQVFTPPPATPRSTTAAPPQNLTLPMAPPQNFTSPPNDNAVLGTRPSATPSGDQDTVTVDGLTYIRGREPQALGTMAEPPPSDPSVSVNAPPPPMPMPASTTPGMTPYQVPDHTPYQSPETNGRGNQLPLPNDVVILPNGQMAIPNR